MKFVPLLSSLALVVLSTPASAHIDLDYPPSTTTNQKSPAPCGVKGQRRPATTTTFKPGEEITVKWTETVSHTGHFRIAFDTDGMDDLKNPTSFTDIKNPPVAPILADGIPHKAGAGKYEHKVKLPNVTCTNCTLQVIQVMTDKPPFGPGGGDDFYYRCADIVLAGDTGPGDGGAPDATVDMSPPGTGGSAGTGGSPGTGGTSTGTGGAPAGTGGATGTGGSGATATGGSAPAGTGGGSSAGRGGSSGSPPPPEEPKSGCSVGGGTPSTWAFGALVFAALIVRRRRKY